MAIPDVIIGLQFEGVNRLKGLMLMTNGPRADISRMKNGKWRQFDAADLASPKKIGAAHDEPPPP